MKHVRPSLRKPVGQLFIAVGALWLLLTSAAFAAAAGDPIGTVVIAVGTVEATDAAGSVRRLARRAPVFEGDTLRTGADSRAQVSFFDDARLALRPQSELAVDEYRDGSAGRTESAALRLTRGGFRTATGRIGRVNRTAYRMSTPYAVIGIRGTDLSGALEDDGTGGVVLIVGVTVGGITVTNSGGAIDLGEGADFDFAQVTGPDDAPQGIDAPPEDMDVDQAFDEAPEEDDAEEDDAEAGEQTPADDAADGGETGAAEQPNVDEEGNLASQIGGEDAGETLFEYGQRCL